MEENKNEFVVYVDTSYLTHMAASEKADWNRLLEFSKACIGDLNADPRVQIHISEIALREYRSKMVDALLSEIEQTKNKMNSLQKEWEKNDITEEIEYPFPKDKDIFPQKNQINAEADRFVERLLSHTITHKSW